MADDFKLVESNMECELIEAEKDWIKSVLEQYRVSYTRGFIPDNDPLVIIYKI
jgi:phosphoribosylamine-glycine ligase